MHFDIHIETGQRVTDDQISEAIDQGVDEPLDRDLTEVNVVCGEFPSDAVGGYVVAHCDDDKDPYGMALDIQHAVGRGLREIGFDPTSVGVDAMAPATN